MPFFFPRYRNFNPNCRKSTLEDRNSSFVATKRKEILGGQHNVRICCECLVRCLAFLCLSCPFRQNKVSRTSQKGYKEKSVFPRCYCRVLAGGRHVAPRLTKSVSRAAPVHKSWHVRVRVCLQPAKRDGGCSVPGGTEPCDLPAWAA